MYKISKAKLFLTERLVYIVIIGFMLVFMLVFIPYLYNVRKSSMDMTNATLISSKKTKTQDFSVYSLNGGIYTVDNKTGVIERTGTDLGQFTPAQEIFVEPVADTEDMELTDFFNSIGVQEIFLLTYEDLDGDVTKKVLTFFKSTGWTEVLREVYRDINDYTLERNGKYMRIVRFGTLLRVLERKSLDYQNLSISD